MAQVIVKLKGQHSSALVKSSLAAQGGKDLPSFLPVLAEALGPHDRGAQIQILNEDAVAASGIITILDYTKMTDGDLYQIGSMVLTAKASGAAADEFNIGASNALSAAALCAAINAYSDGSVRAGVASAIVTVTCNVPGAIGNAIPLIITQADVGASSDASLSAGADDTAAIQSYKSF